MGYDAQQALFAGLIPQTGLVILGRTDGKHWLELARADTTIDLSQQQRLTVRMRGADLEILHNGRKALTYRDSTWQSGAVGLRVVDTDATFRDLQIRPLP